MHSPHPEEDGPKVSHPATQSQPVLTPAQASGHLCWPLCASGSAFLWVCHQDDPSPELQALFPLVEIRRTREGRTGAFSFGRLALQDWRTSGPAGRKWLKEGTWLALVPLPAKEGEGFSKAIKRPSSVEPQWLEARQGYHGDEELVPTAKAASSSVLLALEQEWTYVIPCL